MPTINPTTNHLENKNNGDTDDISIEGGKAEQKTQHQQNIERVQHTYVGPHCRQLYYTWNKTWTMTILDC